MAGEFDGLNNPDRNISNNDSINKSDNNDYRLSLKYSFSNDTEDFDLLFNPKSIAIVGVSKNKIGGIKYFFALKSSGWIDENHHVYLINPNMDELYGQRLYPALDDKSIPKPLDLVIISVPAKIVPQIVKQCHGIVRFAIIYSSGFGESGNTELDDELRAAISYGFNLNYKDKPLQVPTRFIGPNCLGVMNPSSKLMIYPDWERFVGNISYVSMSGGTMARLYFFLGSIGLGMRHIVSIGNSVDLTTIDFLKSFAVDECTHQIAFYLESVPNGREFYNLAKEITPYKPIILWKGGQSSRGIKATMSHTGGLAGSYEIWKGMCRQSGIILADHFELFLDLVQVMSIRPIVPDNLSVAVVVAGGGIGVEFTDNFEKAGLTIPELTEKTQKRLSRIFPSVNTNFKNPVDLGEMGYHPLLFAQALEIIMKDPNIGSIVFVREPERFGIISAMLGIDDAQQMTIDSLTEMLNKMDKKHAKPIFCNPSVNSDSEEAYKARHDFQLKMIKEGIPVINYFKNIPSILFELYRYGRFLRNRI